MADREVIVVRRWGNTDMGPPIAPYPLGDGDKVLSAEYTTLSGNAERLVLVIERTVEKP